MSSQSRHSTRTVPDEALRVGGCARRANRCLDDLEAFAAKTSSKAAVIFAVAVVDLVEEDVQLYVDSRLLGNGGEPAALVQEQFLVPDLDIDRSEAGQVAVEGRGVGAARIGSCEVAVGELLDPLLVEERIL